MIRHSEDIAIRKLYHNNGKLKFKAWLLLGVNLHREDGPAYLEWDADGQLIDESYHIDDKLHRKDGPSLKIWDRENNYYYEANFINNKLVRISGYVFRFYIDEELIYQI